MSEPTPHHPMTDMERGLLDIIQRLQERWAESLSSVMESAITTREQINTLTRDQSKLKDDLLIGIAEIQAGQLRQYRELASMTKAITTLTQEVQALQQLMKDRLF
jgi:hypothetical protein